MEKKGFKLSKLQELGLILNEQDKSKFTERFISFVRGLVYAEAFKCYSTEYTFVGQSLHGSCCSVIGSMYASQMAEANWKRLVNDVEYVNYTEKGDVIRKKAHEIALCRRALSSLWKGSLLMIFRNGRNRRDARQAIKTKDMYLDYQDIFSTAISYFIHKGWGTRINFREEILARI